METPKKKTYVYHNDAGHGWLAVKRKELEDLSIINQITGYSYQKGKTVYLEEDLDMGTFIKAYMQKYGVKPNLKDSYQHNSPIRYYQRFQID
jgi:hypothetical protein